MARSREALNDRMNPERTRELLEAEWVRLGGTVQLLAAYAEQFRSVRRKLSVEEALALSYEELPEPVRPSRIVASDELLAHLHRLGGVAIAIAHLDHFVTHERPLIIKALRLADMQRTVRGMLSSHFETDPDDTELAIAMQVLLERIHERTLEVCESPSAMQVIMARRGKPISHLIRMVVTPLYCNGYDWTEIARLVDDGEVLVGRAERLRKLYESDPWTTMRERLRHRNAELSGEAGR